jgi:hypothetical protein
MASQYDPLHVVRDFSDACVKHRDYAYALGYVGGELLDAINQLPKAKREKFLELLVRRTESLKNS